jgi:hypothetical protein
MTISYNKHAVSINSRSKACTSSQPNAISQNPKHVLADEMQYHRTQVCPSSRPNLARNLQVRDRDLCPPQSHSNLHVASSFFKFLQIVKTDEIYLVHQIKLFEIKAHERIQHVIVYIMGYLICKKSAV